MRPNPLFASDDPDLVRELVREHPWATLVTSASSGLAASHYPVLLDEAAEGLTLLTHLGRPDEEVLEIDQGEVLVIVQGHHGYVDEEENLAVLTRLVDHFERHVPDPAHLEREYAVPIAKGTVGLRILIDRFELKRKLSQNKDEETRRNVIAALREEGRYRHLELAEEMERELAERDRRG